MVREDLVKGRQVTVLGMARSGVAAAKLLQLHGAHVFVSEIKPIDEVLVQAQSLGAEGIKYETGGHTARALAGVDYVVLSPGIAPATPFVRQIQENSIPIFSEIEVTSWLCPATIIAITGSNGKSTTTAWVTHILSEAGRKAVATGNIGSPFAADVGSLGKKDFAVVEVSSFQLEFTDRFQPRVASILNITPDHLDRYREFSAYAEAKCRIADSQEESDYLVLNADDRNTADPKIWGNPKRIFFSTRIEVEQGVFTAGDELRYVFGANQGSICKAEQVGIPGPHNLANAAAAASMCLCVGLAPKDIAAGLESFKGIEHRLEFAGEHKGVRFVNDSKATNVDSVNYALQSIPKPIVLIMGGRDKGGDFTSLADLVAEKVKLIALIGETQDLIDAALGEHTRTVQAQDIFEAVRVCYNNAEPGDTVLLSPGCASFDQFTDFEDRGRKFKQAVKDLINGNS
jgi:UDP-N-acetylmuramoylalanine--D-glutamate ligase